MDFMICDANKNEIDELKSNVSMDFDLGDTNDVKITCPLGTLSKGQYVVCFGTEYGALMEESIENTNSGVVTWYGNAFRRFLDEFIIEPPAGEDYLIMSGDAHDIMRTVLSGAFDGMFEVPAEASGITYTNYQFPRYVSALEGFSKMLSDRNARININIIQGGSNEPFSVELSAVRVNNLSDEIQFSEDSRINIEVTDSQRGITKLICLGKGELKDRQVAYLYAWPDGSIRQTEYYTGLRRRTAVYKYDNAESLKELIDKGTERLKELMSYKKMTMSVSDAELQIGDIVMGKVYASGTTLKKPVVEKTLTIKNGNMSVDYKVEGEE